MFSFFKKSIHEDTLIEFKKQLGLLDNNDSVISYNEKENNLYIMLVINKKILFISKQKEINKEEIDIENIKIKNISKELLNSIYLSKYNGSVVKSEHIIEYISNLINNKKYKYNIGLKEQHYIWEIIIKFNSNFYNENIINLPKDISNTELHKWID